MALVAPGAKSWWEAQEITMGGQTFPWYLGPFFYRDKAVDPFLKARGLFNKLRRAKERDSSIEHKYDVHHSRDKAVDPFPAVNGWADIHWKLCCENQAYFIHQHFHIRDKFAKIVLFDHWNPLQRKLWWVYAYQQAYNPHGVRIDVLKARQVGASTLVEALICAILFTRKNQLALLMSNKEMNTKRNFAMVERFYRYLTRGDNPLPARFLPLRQNHSTTSLALGDPRRAHQEKKTRRSPQRDEVEGQAVLDSTLSVLTASSTMAEVGFTANLFHGTELAQWPTPEDMWENIKPGIPDVPGTIIIRESTAWAPYDWWHKRVLAAQADKSGYDFVFSGWQEFPKIWHSVEQRLVSEYSRDVPEKYKGANGRAEFYKQLSNEIKEAIEQYGLTLEQARWMETKCSDGDWSRFRRQYPLSPAEAFQTTGRNFFSSKAVEHYLAVTNPVDHGPPGWTGILTLDAQGFVKQLERGTGPIRIWRPPIAGHQYVVGADAAEGINPDGDYSAAMVMDVGTLEEVATLWGRMIKPKLFARLIMCLSRLYSEAFVVPESTGSAGSVTTEYLQPEGEFSVNYLYIHEDVMQVKSPLRTTYGYRTGGAAAKLALLDGYREEVDAKTLTLHSHEHAQELGGFIQREKKGKSKKKEYGPSDSHKGHDDTIIAGALCLRGILCDQRRNLGGNMEGHKLMRLAQWEREEQKSQAARERAIAGAELPLSVLLDKSYNGIIHSELGEFV